MIYRNVTIQKVLFFSMLLLVGQAGSQKLNTTTGIYIWIVPARLKAIPADHEPGQAWIPKC